MKKLALLAAAVVGIPLTAYGAAPPDPAVVRTETGVVRGAVTDDLRTFRGIPYAVVSRRWAAPRPAPAWGGTRAATAFGPGCWQPTDLPIAAHDQADDCLNVNVTTPPRPRGLPVVVYFHGGSFTYGTGANYRPDTMVTRGNVVAVTLNYRLGAFGFLAHPALGDANLGIADQQAALRWVRDNIAAFGGNPRNVTIMGQSAGGYSVCAHLASPASAGLFQRAIVQSAPCAGADAARDRADAEQQGLAFAAGLGCGDQRTALRCLRGKTPAELLAAAGTGHDGYRPVTGGTLLPVAPARAFETGRFNQVPVLYGGNHDEETGQLAGLELVPGAKPIDAAAYPGEVAEWFGGDAAAVLAEYPLTAYGSPSQALAAALTDDGWALPTDATRRLLARHVPVFAYEFAERDTPWFPGAPAPSFPVGASHLLELPYLFTVGYLTPAAQPELRHTMIDYWTRFAHAGKPDTRGLPGWPTFHSGQYVQSLSAAAVRRTDFRVDHHLAFWHRLAG